MTASTASPFPRYRYRGIVIALAVMTAWAGHLVYTLTSVPVSGGAALLHVPIQTVLNVGLFITAHDAMHRIVAPEHRRLNDAIGAVALFAYAAFLFEPMRTAHWAHHAHPVTSDDPDYTHDSRERFWPWLYDFGSRYYSWRNFLLMHVHVIGFWLLSGSIWAVLLYFAVPAWLSALQLFYFGTYLPHRTPEGGHTDRHNAQSNDYPEWLSLLTCFHFGYHREHHHYPNMPWWRLPALRRHLKARDAGWE